MKIEGVGSYGRFNLDSLDDFTRAEIEEAIERQENLEMALNKLISENNLDPMDKKTYLRLISILQRKKNSINGGDKSAI